MYVRAHAHTWVCSSPSCRICRLLFVCINKSKTASAREKSNSFELFRAPAPKVFEATPQRSLVKPRFRSLTMQKYKLPQTKTPYAVGTRRGVRSWLNIKQKINRVEKPINHKKIRPSLWYSAVSALRSYLEFFFVYFVVSIFILTFCIGK